MAAPIPAGRGGNKPAALAIDGERVSGQEVRTQNVTACLAIANSIRTSFGPEGLDKMLVDDIGDVSISNDGATILKTLEVEHPAAKVLVELADLQDQEVGDGTTSVVLLAAELLKNADELIKQKIHPTNVISGYRLCCKEACKYITEHLSVKSGELTRTQLIAAAKTSLNSKILGPESDLFGPMCVDAMMRVKTVQSNGDVIYPLKAVNILKAMGKSVKESQYVEGFALNCTIASQAMPKRIHGAKIACLDFNLNKAKMGQGIQIIAQDSKKLEEIRLREADLIKERIHMILKAGANVVLTTKGIDDLCLKYFVEAGAMAVRRVTREDCKRIARATGATFLLNLANLEGEESFDPSYLGTAEEVSQERIADDELIIIKGTKTTGSSSIICRGANTVMLEEMERSLRDCLSVVKRALESNALVAGGGAVETALNVYLERFAKTLGSREQLPVAEFAHSLLVIPKTLAVNAAHDATELVAQLRAYHTSAQTSDAKEKKNTGHIYAGLDLKKGKAANNLENGVLEPAMAKIKMLQFATEAAITILRIDDLIKLNPKRDPQGGDEY